MSTIVDVMSRRRLWWAVAGLVLIAVLVVAVLRFVGGSPAELPAGLRTELATRITTLLEHSSVADKLVHDGMSTNGTVVCAVDPFGVDPRGAGTVGRVRTVYALHLCVLAVPGASWDYSTKASGPIAVGLAGPAQVRVADPGRGYPDRVRALIPSQYQKRAFGVFTDRQALVLLRQRFAAVAG
jgi:hypothetical protein